jgi:hypothetical protein
MIFFGGTSVMEEIHGFVVYLEMQRGISSSVVVRKVQIYSLSHLTCIK